jgi:hypothetical protein
MRWALAAIVLLALAAPGEGALSCRSGVALYDEGGVRIFETVDRDGAPTWWGCSAKVRRPHRIVELSPSVTNELYVSPQVGNRLPLAVEEFADGGGNWEAGWFDVRTGAAATAFVDTKAKDDFTSPALGVTTRTDGDLAYVLRRQDDEGETIAREIVFRAFTSGKFAAERKLASAPVAEVDPDTIAFDGDDVTWRTEGAPRSVPIATHATPTAAPARTAISTALCKTGESLYDGGFRVFARRTGRERGIFVCTVAKRPRIAVVTRARPRTSRFTENDRYLAFAIGPTPGSPGGGLVRVDGRTGRLRVGNVPLGPYGKPPRIDAIAIGPGGVAAATDVPAILYLPGAGGGLRELAALKPGDIAPHTLRADSRKVAWRELGELRRAPTSASRSR